LDISAQDAAGGSKAPSSKLVRAWNGVKKAWSWANQSPLRQVLLGVGAIAVGATISAATGGAAGLIGVPFILTGVYMVLKAVARAAPVKGYLDKLYPKKQAAGVADSANAGGQQPTRAAQTQTDRGDADKVRSQSCPGNLAFQ
jgi:hypothetical protein